MYDITDFALSHPGGAQLLALAAGRDATILFESHHLRPDVVTKTLSTLPRVKAEIGLCPDETFPKPLDSLVYTNIQQRVRAEILAPLEKAQGRKTAGRGGCQLDVAAVILFSLVVSCWYVLSPTIFSGCMLGFAGYWAGTGLQHTANHGGLCQSARWNEFWGWFGCDILLGKSSLEWRYHHMVSHHSYCNDSQRDQDVYTSFPVIRLDESQEWFWFHRFQPYYTPLVWPLLYAFTQIGDFINVLLKKASPGVQYLGVTNTEVLLYVFGKIFHFAFIFALPAYCHGVSRVLVPFLAYGLVGSFVLCWFFIVSHNLDGLQPNQLSKGSREDWGRWQIETSATWGNSFWSFFSGGLNYQIEHHLFPGTAHNLYPAMQSIIKDECFKAGITYNSFDGYLGIFSITSRMFSFLSNMSINPCKRKC